MKKFIFLFLLLLFSNISFGQDCSKWQIEVVNHWPQEDVITQGWIGPSWKLVNPQNLTIEKFVFEIRDSSGQKIIRSTELSNPPYFVRRYWDTTQGPDAYYLLTGYAHYRRCIYSSLSIWIWVNNYGE